jgi:hypothetical protein
LKTLLDLRGAFMAQSSVAVDRQHIPAWFVQHPKFSVSIPIEPAAIQDTSEIEGEACGSGFRLDGYGDELLPPKLCGRLFNSPERRGTSGQFKITGSQPPVAAVNP